MCLISAWMSTMAQEGSFITNAYCYPNMPTLKRPLWDQICKLAIRFPYSLFIPNPDSKVHGANMGPIWGWKDPGGPHVGPMNVAIWEYNGVPSSRTGALQ